MYEHLRTDLTAIADRSRSVDLTDRTRATARRQRVTRAVVVGVAVLVLAGGAVWGGMAWPRDNAGAPPAASNRQVVTELDGDFVFTRGAEVITWRLGDEPEALRGIEDPDPASYRISPDGVLLSYLDGDGQPRLHDLVTDEAVAMPAGVVVDADGDPPVWAPDSRRLWVDTGRSRDRYGFFDIESGDFTASQDPAGRDTVVVREPGGDGEMLISLRDGGDGTELVSVTPDGGEEVLSAGPLQGTGEYITDIVASDADGSRMCLDTDDEKTARPAEHPSCRTYLNYDAKAVEGVAPVSSPLLTWVDGEESEDATAVALIDDSGQRVQQFADRATLVTGVDKTVDEVRLPAGLLGADTELVSYRP